MSDLCMYELEDNVWDEFSKSDDHIVPHRIEECDDHLRLNGDNKKKQRREIIGIASDTGGAIHHSPKKKEASLLTLTKKDSMLDKELWSHRPDGVFPVSCDNESAKEVASIPSKEIKASNLSSKSMHTDPAGGQFTADDLICGEKTAADDNDAYHFQLDHISQTDNDLNFFNNDHEDKENNDLLYYEWPDDIGNFEDVDRMFRSCDSIFGLGSLSNEEDLCWFPSSHSAEGSEDALKLGSKNSSSEVSGMNCIPDHHESSRINSASVNGSNKISLSVDDNTCAADQSSFSHFQFSNQSDVKSVTKDIPKEQISSPKSQARKGTHSEGKRKVRNLDNCGSFHHNGNFKQGSNTKFSPGKPSHKVFSPGFQQHKPETGSDALGYIQMNIPYAHVNYDHPSDLVSLCPSQSGVKSEGNGLPSPSLKESSLASNQVQSMESSLGPSLEAPAIMSEEERPYHQELEAHYGRKLKCANVASPTAYYESLQNQTQQCDYDVESHSDFEGVRLGVPAELDSNGQESSCMSSALDEISLEATSFRQLQQVMEKLDIRTKLCIRDSLYRLARSAEQRHSYANANGGQQDDRDASSPLLVADKNKSTGFLDMETDTNPIDRSIAHLLFHRPSDPSVVPVNNALSLKSHTVVHGSITCPPVISSEHISQEESAGGVDKTL